MSEYTMPFKVATQNCGHRFVRRNPTRTKNMIRSRLAKYGIVALQEAGSKEVQKILTDLQDEGYAVFRGDKGTGQWSTPIVWDTSRFNLHHAKAYPLTPALRIAEGVGPTFIKPKWAMKVCFMLEDGPDQRHVNVINVHGLTSVWAKVRHPWVRQFFTRLTEVANDQIGGCVILGDFNTKFEGRWMSILIQGANMRSLQEMFGPMGTMHNNRSGGSDARPDDVLVRRDGKMLPIGLHTEVVWSDHKTLIGDFKIKPKRRK